MRRLKSKSGIALVYVILITLIGALTLSIVLYLYMQHLETRRLLIDEAQVTQVKRFAKDQYVLDMVDEGITYYYDYENLTLIDASTVVGRANIKGYGRSYEDENLHGETGAVGIPNRGADGGPQFLAVSVEADGSVHARWQGQVLTAEDYVLMTDGERSRLNQSQKNQIGRDLVSRESETESEEEE